MSIAFSDTTNKDGLIQRVEQELGFPDAYISGNSTRLAQWTGSLNLALDKVFAIIFSADGRWQFDDSNHTTYPILTTNLVANQRDYSFTADSGSNLILEIHRVFARNSTSSPYYELLPLDVQMDEESEITKLVDGLNTTGDPTHYDKTATGLFLDPIPSGNVTAGLKVYVSREGSYFATSDTTKLPGFAGLFHEYLVLDACYRYARAHRLQNQEVFKRELNEMEKEIKKFYSRRDKHERKIMTPKKTYYI